MKLFSRFNSGKISFKNRLVMAPMTRCRAIGNIPNDLMAKYYSQRAEAGLIITEGTSPSPNGLGYARIPGIFNHAQVEGWRKVTNAVHAGGSNIFLQMMHTGRISNNINMPPDSLVVAPSEIKAAGMMWTDQQGMQEHNIPVALTTMGIQTTIGEFVTGANNAIAAGFDGVELHAANGYLLEQFLSPHSNIRTDNYGGNIENRLRFVLEIIEKVANAVGKDKTGIRISPFGTFNDMPEYAEVFDTYALLAEKLNNLGIAYIHVINHPSLDKQFNGRTLKQVIRENFHQAIIFGNGYNLDSANKALQNNEADFIAFGRAFINNPDLVQRLAHDLPLAQEADQSTFYTPGEKGYIDYAPSPAIG
ncbi:MAG: alkene reductase [Chitinophagaceae bacterium]